MLLGHWTNFDDLEENLTLEELYALLEAKRDHEYEDKRFHAAMQGKKLPSRNESKFEEIRERAAKRKDKQNKLKNPDKTGAAAEADVFEKLHIAFVEE